MTASRAIARVSLVAFLTLWLAACTATGTVSPAPLGSATPGPTPLPPSAAPSAPSTAPGSPAVDDAGPPAARLHGIAPEPVAGDLGTFAWDGLVSDSPWIVGATAGRVPQGAMLTVSFSPPLSRLRWQARWATVASGQAGTPRDGGSGTMDDIEVAAPTIPGAWSLQVAVRLGPGRNATWYWRVDVAPR